MIRIHQDLLLSKLGLQCKIWNLIYSQWVSNTRQRFYSMAWMCAGTGYHTSTFMCYTGLRTPTGLDWVHPSSGSNFDKGELWASCSWLVIGLPNLALTPTSSAASSPLIQFLILTCPKFTVRTQRETSQPNPSSYLYSEPNLSNIYSPCSLVSNLRCGSLSTDMIPVFYDPDRALLGGLHWNLMWH